MHHRVRFAWKVFCIRMVVIDSVGCQFSIFPSFELLFNEQYLNAAHMYVLITIKSEFSLLPNTYHCIHRCCGVFTMLSLITYQCGIVVGMRSFKASVKYSYHVLLDSSVICYNKNWFHFELFGWWRAIDSILVFSLLYWKISCVLKKSVSKLQLAIKVTREIVNSKEKHKHVQLKCIVSKPIKSKIKFESNGKKRRDRLFFQIHTVEIIQWIPHWLHLSF